MEISEFLQEFPKFRPTHEVRVAYFLSLFSRSWIDNGNNEQLLTEVFQRVVHGNIEVRNRSWSLIGFYVVSEIPFVRSLCQFYVDTVLPERLGNYLINLELRTEVVIEEQHGLVHAFQMTKNELERMTFSNHNVQFLIDWKRGSQDSLNFSDWSIICHLNFR